MLVDHSIHHWETKGMVQWYLGYIVKEFTKQIGSDKKNEQRKEITIATVHSKICIYP